MERPFPYLPPGCESCDRDAREPSQGEVAHAVGLNINEKGGELIEMGLAVIEDAFVCCMQRRGVCHTCIHGKSCAVCLGPMGRLDGRDLFRNLSFIG